MTYGESRGLRAFAIVVLAVATLGMLALSMLTNATFGYRFGSTTLTAVVFAAANVIADIWKGLGLIIVAGLLRERHRSVAAMLAALWVVALLFGVASLASHHQWVCMSKTAPRWSVVARHSKRHCAM
jgi:hypothetical protein